MKYSTLLTLGGSLILFLSACEEKPQVVEKPTAATTNFETARLGTAIDTYIATPSDAQAADVEKAFAEIDGEIAELDQRASSATGAERTEAQTKAGDLRAYRDKEKMRYTEAQARAKTNAAGEQAESAAQKVGEGVRDAADAVKTGVDNAVDTVKENLP
jgi:hypothetical protein